MMSEEKKDQPPKKRPTKKKIVVDKTGEDLEVDELLRDALKIVIKKKHVRQPEHEIEAMVDTCSEFMKSFIIMGYDLENKAIEPIFYAKNDLEADALANYLQKYFINNTRMH